MLLFYFHLQQKLMWTDAVEHQNRQKDAIKAVNMINLLKPYQRFMWQNDRNAGFYILL